MSASRVQAASARTGSIVQACRLAVLGAALLAAGCASTKNQASHGGHSPAGGPAARTAAVWGEPRVEIEDDGLPVQSPPRWRSSVEPDDPTEPFSPNYGRMPPQPPDQPVRPTRVSTLDEEALISRAVAAHEMRQP